MNRYKQRGYNSKYPEIIEIWKFGDTTMPEWISDNAKIKKIEEDGEILLDYRETSTGGVEIKNSTGLGVLIRTSSLSDLICKGINNSDKIFSLTEKQFNLLYYKD